MTLFFIKYISLLITSRKGRKLQCGRATDTETRRSLAHTGGGLLYWIFLSLHCDSIFWGLSPLFPWREFLNWGSAVGHSQPGGIQDGFYYNLAVPRSSLPELHDWLSACRFLCAYNFITPTRSSDPWFTWSASICQPTWAAFLEHPVPEIPDWRFCQGSVRNIRILGAAEGTNQVRLPIRLEGEGEPKEFMQSVRLSDADS